MRHLAAGAIIPAMTRPTPSHKVLLVADRRGRPTEPTAVPVRRFRLARLRLDGRTAGSASRFDHLKRVYD
jgi:hypothetical protein